MPKTVVKKTTKIKKIKKREEKKEKGKKKKIRQDKITKRKITEQEKTSIVKKESVKKESQKFIEAIGRRKTSSARVRLFPYSDFKDIIINNKPYKEYFSLFSWQKTIEAPLKELKFLGKFGVSVKVKGGGVSSQSEACRHGIARAIVLFDSSLRKKLKDLGFLTRDPRERERKKFGLKRARRAPQWSKR